MMDVTCLCGGIRVRTTKQPDFVNECNCTLCTKSGARWAYFHPSEVRVEGESAGYSRRDKAEPAADVRFCSRCGVATHFVLTPQAVARHGNGMMGVNSRLASDEELVGVEVRYPDGRAWSGKGPFGHVRERRIIGAPDAG